MSRDELQPLVRDRRPLYIQAVTPILDLAAHRNLGPGDCLPSEVELAGALGVGRSTIREALRHLELAGLVERRRGIGTVIIQPHTRVEMGLERLESLETLARRQGWHCGTSKIEVGMALATEEQAERLQIEQGSPVTVITRIKTRDTKPFAEMISIVPASVISVHDLEATFRDSITDLLGPGGLNRLRYARAEVSAVACDALRATRLGLEAGQPLLVVDELFLADSDEALAWNLLYFAPGTLRLEVIRLLTPAGGARGASAIADPTGSVII